MSDIVQRLRMIVASGNGGAFEKHIMKAAAEIERLREALSIYVHAHRTENAVPSHIESRAMDLIARQPLPAPPEGEP